MPSYPPTAHCPEAYRARQSYPISSHLLKNLLYSLTLEVKARLRYHLATCWGEAGQNHCYFFFFKDDTLPKHKRYTLRSLKESWLLFLFSYANWFAGYTSQIFLSHWYQLSTNHVNKNRYVEICHWGILKQPADVKLYKYYRKYSNQTKINWLTDRLYCDILALSWVFVT